MSHPNLNTNAVGSPAARAPEFKVKAKCRVCGRSVLVNLPPHSSPFLTTHVIGKRMARNTGMKATRTCQGSLTAVDLSDQPGLGRYARDWTRPAPRSLVPPPSLFPGGAR